MTTTLDAPRLGTRATLVHVRKLGRFKPRCACCGQATLFKGPSGKKGYSREQAVVAQVYVSETVPLGPIGSNPREAAPAVFDGGVWARREFYRVDPYEAAGEPYGPVLKGQAA